MKNGTTYARRVKAFFSKLKKLAGSVSDREPAPIIEELLFAILARETTDERANRALATLQRSMVDLNELRVTTPREITHLIGEDFPEATAKSVEIREVLEDIVHRQNRLDLSSLRQKGLREAREYLETLRGVSPFAASWVFSRSLGGHAIPIDDNMIRALKEEALIDPGAEPADVQSFLERHIPAAEGQRFQTLLRDYALSRGKSRARKAATQARPQRRGAAAGTGAAASQKRLRSAGKTRKAGAARTAKTVKRARRRAK